MILSKKSIIGLTLATLMSTTVLAQESTSEDNSSTITYDEGYFTQYRPITLHDMLRSVPGTAALLAKADEELGGSRVRGFGSSGDQILIDGKRIAGKTNSLGLQLKRIQASSVRHIELIRGTKAGLDVQSEGLIINVVLKSNASKSSTVWTVGADYADGGKINPLAKVTHTGEIDRLKYSLAVDFALEETRKDFNDTFFTAGGAQYQNNTLTNIHDREKIFINTSVEYNAENGDTLRLNGQLEFDDQDTLEVDNQMNLLDNGSFLAGDDYTINRLRTHRPFHWEFGGDYQHRFENAGLLKTLFVINHGKHDFVTNFQGGLNGGALATLSGNLTGRTHGEKIIRSSLTNTFNKVHTVEVGGEVAINDTGTSSTSTNAAGVINLANQSDISVQEVRYQAFISHNYAIASNISLQSSLNAEWSKITQKDNIHSANPDFSRNFSYLKPRMNLRYDMDKQNQIRITAERKISQLDFGSFGNSFDVEDNEVDEGNPLLVPEDRLEFSAAYENRFADDQGSISVKAFYNKIRDHISKIPNKDINDIRTTNAQLAVSSLPGNIGNAKEYGVEFNGSLRLKIIDLPNAIISGKYILRETEANDPFLGLTRPILYKQKHEWLITFQHDLTGLGTSYGFNITNKGASGPGGGSIGYRTDVKEQWFKSNKPKATFYVEQKVFGNMKLRFDAKNILKAKTSYALTKYTGNISLGNVAYEEFRKASEQRVFKISLQGSF
ncbi:MAG: TonB-dependent receptor plug domain-containing protein [Emcibacteraceae bacterium]|nr:TonB-dependent receptor plug domain-containing protein [Emcibacteraceae bacterium]